MSEKGSYQKNILKIREYNRFYRIKNREKLKEYDRVIRRKWSKTKKYQLYRRWVSIKQRCYNPNCRQYKDYGSRGIELCNKWMQFEGFKKDMECNFSPELTLDRIDNDGNYCLENCRWVDYDTQNNNTRRNRFIKYKGIVKTLGQWIKYFDFKKSRIKTRFYCMKWPIEKCFEYREV